MKANEFYRQWITDYRKEKNDKSGEPIQDGDLLDWLAQKFERGELKQLPAVDEYRRGFDQGYKYALHKYQIADKLYEENKRLKYWMNADIDTVKKYLNENVSDFNNYNKSKQKLLCEIAKRLK